MTKYFCAVCKFLKKEWSLVVIPLLLIASNLLLKGIFPDARMFLMYANWKCTLALILYYADIYLLLKISYWRNFVILLLLPWFVLLFDILNFATLDSLAICMELSGFIFLSLLLQCILVLTSILGGTVNRIFCTLLQWLSLLPLIAALWICFSSQPFNEDIIIAIWQTNFRESVEYCLQYWYSIFLPFFFILSFFLIFKFVTVSMKIFKCKRPHLIALGGLFVLMLPVCGGVTYLNYRNHAFLLCSYIDSIRAYQDSIQLFKTQLSQYKIDADGCQIKRKANIAIIIGESQSSFYMNSQNSPFIESLRTHNKERFFWFCNAYANFTQTVQSLTYALTNKNQYHSNTDENVLCMTGFLTSLGYHSLWLSNQNQYGVFGETEISAMAAQCNQVIFLDKIRPVGFFDSKDDFRLLDHLPTHMDVPYVVFIQLFGSHHPYTYITTKENENLSPYQKSLYYTDSFLKKLSSALIAQKIDVIVYFSDHGEFPGIGHDFRNLKIPMVTIPCWVYLSERFANDHRDLCEQLKNAQDKVFTNDLIFNLLGGILQISGNSFPEELNVLSEKYLIRTTGDAKILHGKMTVEELLQKKTMQ